MAGLSIPAVILWGYVVICLLYWLALALGTVKAVRGVPRLADVEPPEPGDWPRLSVVVPACNEADAIEPAAASVLAQDYPNLELILVDDRSDDGTGLLVDRVAASDPRVCAVRVRELPEGWLGKVHALNRGLDQSRGEWLLFADADVHLSPGTLRRAVAWAEARGLDHLAATPDMWSTGLLIDATISLFLRVFCVATRIWTVEDSRSSAYIGVGAFNMVRRSAYDRTAGFEWLRMEVADDVGLGMMIKHAGGRSGVVNGAGCLGLHWYPTLGGLARGTEKAYASVAHCSVIRGLAVSALMPAMEWSPWIAVGPWGVPGVRWAGAAMIALWLFAVVLGHRWVRRPLWPGLLSPPAVLIAMAMMLRAVFLGRLRGGIVWRGTLYPSRLLKQGRRVTI